MKQSKFTVWVILLSFLLSSCSSLTKTQSKAVNQYFQTVNSYSLYAEEMNISLAHIKLNRIQLYPNSFSEDSIMIESLSQSLKDYRYDMQTKGELKTTLVSYDKYIKDYFLLIPNGFNVIKILESTSVTIAGFFGLSRVAAGAFSNIKSVKISPRKAKKIKSHIKHGNPIVENTREQVQFYINTNVLPTLKNEHLLLKENYSKFLENIKNSHDSYNYYAEYNTIFIEHYKLILNTEKFAQNLLAVTNKISVVQNELSQIVDTRQKLESNVKNIHELYLLMNELNRTVAQFESLQ